MDFWSQFWPQLAATLVGLCLGFPITLFATLVGVGLGIPTGLYLEGLIESRTGKEKTKTILSLLRDELGKNLDELDYWRSAEKGDMEFGTIGIKLIIEEWSAFSGGGELKWIKDLVIRHNLSVAYYNIKVVQNYSEKFYDLTIFGGRRIQPHLKKNIIGRLNIAVTRAKDSIESVMKILDERSPI